MSKCGAKIVERQHQGPWFRRCCCEPERLVEAAGLQIACTISPRIPMTSAADITLSAASEKARGPTPVHERSDRPQAQPEWLLGWDQACCESGPSLQRRRAARRGERVVADHACTVGGHVKCVSRRSPDFQGRDARPDVRRLVGRRRSSGKNRSPMLSEQEEAEGSFPRGFGSTSSAFSRSDISGAL